MEDTLRVCAVKRVSYDKKSLNPCFNGRYSQSKFYFTSTNLLNVLILVLMEDTLRVSTSYQII